MAVVRKEEERKTGCMVRICISRSSGLERKVRLKIATLLSKILLNEILC